MEPMEPKVNRLKARADKVHADKIAKIKQEAEEQVAAFYREMGPLADRGLYAGEYRKPLNGDALKTLKEEGIKLRDGGEGVATLWYCTWSRKEAMTDQVFTIPESEYHELAQSYGGICLACGEFQWEGVEPDAEGYKCDACGAMQVTGIEQALIAGRIEFGEG